MFFEQLWTSLGYNFTIWVGFNLFILGMLALDLGVFHRKSHTLSIREALLWSAFWILLSLAFNALVYYWRGPVIAMEFLTGYLIEKSLSVDNLFVILLIFTYFKVPSKYQHKVLFWGIIGALVLRGSLIFLGTELILRYTWIIYIFGGFLIITGLKIFFEKEGEDDIDPSKNIIVRIFKRFYPTTDEYHEGKFFVKEGGKRLATPLFLALIAVEVTDLIFALDSIPAILAVSSDRFIVYSTNVFAILGLRSLFFALAGLWEMFKYLKIGLSFILIFVGIKMCIAHTAFKIPTPIALVVIGIILLLSVVVSIIAKKREVTAKLLKEEESINTISDDEKNSN